MTCPPLEEEEKCNTNPCGGGCVVSDWGAWSTCNPCKLTQERTRTIAVQPTNGGVPCPATVMTRKCMTAASCDCMLSWSMWSPCTKSCGGGQQERTRKPKSPKVHCSGQRAQFQKCGTQPCPTATPPLRGKQ
eukprot:TRINITY_DN35501_c0_g1_i1.p3 TRINITY_DN35501_c0_g1~~TRINITY_DN35501_c0_g1_i1.p3  ORF type:complete len:132 (-),score=11.27 TRINITY_DN35501_c0_g1_i1:41-436(-)